MLNLKNLFNKNPKGKGENGKVYIATLETQIVDHCNLKCNRCSHFCHLIEDENIVDLKEYENDFIQLSKNFQISYIKILGGEPLLHPNINEILEITRKYFPKSAICIVSNGILLKSMNELFWNTMRKNNIGIELSKYPILGNSFSELLDLVDDNNVKLYKVILAKKFYCSFNPNGDSNADDAFRICGGKLMVLYRHKLYPCIACYRQKYNEINNSNFPTPPFLDIYNITKKTITQFKETVSKPLSSCKYCDDIGKAVPWELYKKEEL